MGASGCPPWCSRSTPAARCLLELLAPLRLRGCFRGERLVGPDEDLFSGEFWTGPRAVELGLIDAIGEIRAVLRERFGERVKMIPVRDRQGLFGGRFNVFARRGVALDDVSLAAIAPAVIDQLIAAVEERATWQRYGL